MIIIRGLEAENHKKFYELLPDLQQQHMTWTWDDVRKDEAGRKGIETGLNRVVFLEKESCTMVLFGKQWQERKSVSKMYTREDLLED